MTMFRKWKAKRVLQHAQAYLRTQRMRALVASMVWEEVGGPRWDAVFDACMIIEERLGSL